MKGRWKRIKKGGEEVKNEGGSMSKGRGGE